MPLFYGTTPTLPPITSPEISSRVFLPPRRKPKPNTHSILNIFLTIAEIASAFIPGLGIWAETAIGAGFGIARLINDAVAGEINPVNSAIDIATAFIPVGGKLVKGAKDALKVSRVEKSITSKLSRELEITGGRTTTKIKRLRNQLETINRASKTRIAFGDTNQIQKAIRKQIASLESKQISKQAKSTLTSAIKNLDSEISNYSRGGKSFLDLQKSEEKIKRDITKFLRSDDKIKVNAFLRDSYAKSQTRVLKNFNQLITTLSTRGRNTLSNNMIRFFDGKALSEVIGASRSSRIKQFFKKVGSRNFNDNFVQKVQLIDPNDAGRAPIEFAYQKAKQWANKKLDKFKKWRKYKKVRKFEKKLESTFVKNGGKLIGSRYIYGIKPLFKKIKKWEVLVQFRKSTTSGLTGKNKNGKKDLIVDMTDYDIEQMVERPGSDYWWEVGEKKGWIYSRGGQSFSHYGAVGSELSLFLSLVPLPALKNMVSITSNVVENIAGWATGRMNVMSWIDTFEQTFIRSTVNRTGRLIAQTGVKKFGGKFLGRLFQKLSTTTIGVLRDHKKASTAFKNAFTQQFTSNFRRVARKHGNSNIIRHQSNIRNTKITRSVGSAVIVGRVKMPKIKI